MELSRNCREAQQRGEPNSAHVCLGCAECPCHHIPPPIPLRELRDRIRAETQPEEAP